MSTTPHSFSKLPRGLDVLGELLHSLSQPLTSLRCSLELSIEEVAERQQESVSAALQQTEKVIGMIQLMREYLDAEQPGPEAGAVALASALRNVIEELSSIAAVWDIELSLTGTCTATLPVSPTRLRLALQYLIAAMIDAQPAGGKLTLLLEEGPAGAVLRADAERGFREAKHDPARAISASVVTLRRVRLAIASRLLENAGASLVFGDASHTGVDSAGFVLRTPSRVGTRAVG